MSRPGPVITADGRADSPVGTPSVRRARPAGALARVSAAGPARAAVEVGAPPGSDPLGAPDAAVAPAGEAGPVASTALVPDDPARLPALVTPSGPRLTLVQRVTLMLQRLGRGQGRHRQGHSCHHWSMFAPHPGARRRPGMWLRR